MGMKFQPKSEKEIQESQLAPKGDYDFEVLFAEDTKSKKTGDPMIKVKLGIYNGEAIRWHVTDYLIASMEAKLRHFCDSVGLLRQYENGTLCAEDCKGRAGKCRLIVKEDEKNQYPPKNEVKDYVLRTAKPIGAAKAEPTAKPDEDDVPF